MKIAAGIIGIGISILVMIQAMAITGIGRIAQEDTMHQAGAVGVLVAFLMFVAGAFSFSLPNVGRFIFALAALIAFLIRADFPDMGIWAVVALMLAAFTAVAARQDKAAAPKGLKERKG